MPPRPRSTIPRSIRPPPTRSGRSRSWSGRCEVRSPAMTEDVQTIRRLFRDIPMCRVATVRPDGGPHVAPRWFVWLEDAIWVATRVGDTTWQDALRDPRVSVLID